MKNTCKNIYYWCHQRIVLTFSMYLYFKYIQLNYIDRIVVKKKLLCTYTSTFRFWLLNYLGEPNILVYYLILKCIFTFI